MPPPSIARQIVLPWKKSLEMTIQSIRVRFFRSLITVSSLVLAISFLALTLISADMAAGILVRGGEKAVTSLIDAGFTLDGARTSILTSPRDRWIIVLSLLVCTVGIVNAQLMSVTERFREIGIMKCLGALDRIILRLFLLEALIQGLAGSCAGALLGFFLALGQGLIRFGPVAWTAMPWGAVGQSLVLSTLAGCFLSILGVLYPALLAARMKPVDVMKSEP